MPNFLNISSVFAAVLLSALLPAVSAAECDFFKVEGGYLESVGPFGGNAKCSPYLSVGAAKEECRSMVGCDGFSFGPWGTGLGGCLKINRKGGFNANPEYVGYHKTLMGCCGDDRLEKAQCHVQESRRAEKLVSWGKPTTQSSTYQDPQQTPMAAHSGRAVDGDKNPQWSGKSCTHTLETPNPWWSVDLQDAYEISRVEITNRVDCCWDRLSNLMISVGDNPFSASHRGCLVGGAVGQGETKSFPCALRGRFVTITIVKPKEVLTLCEVEVYAMVDTVNERENKSSII